VAGKSTGIRMFELDVSISGPLDVPFEDWPANVQDGILQALERKSKEVQLPLKIVHAKYMTDPDLPKDAPGYHYLHVVASEVVMADERTIDPERVVQELPDDIKRLLN
jgi:hypothetical protein